MSDQRKRLVRNVLSNWGGFVVNLTVAFLLSPFLVNRLGAAAYGLWVILNQFTGYMSILDLGVRSAVTKHVAAYHATKDAAGLNRIVSSAVSIYAVVSVVVLVITAGAVMWLPSLFSLQGDAVREARIVIAIGGLTVAQAFVFNVYYGILMGIQRYDLFNRLAVLYAIGKAIAIVILLRRGHGIVALAALQGLTSVANNLSACWYCRRELPQLRVGLVGRRDGAYAEVFHYSTASFFVAVSQKIIYQADVFVVGAFAGPAAVTVFSIPGTLIDYLRRIIIAMTETFVPLTSQLKAASGLQQIRDLALRGTRAATLVGAPMCVGLLTVGERFVGLWMGPSYAADGRSVLLLLAVTQLLSVSHMACREVLNGLGRHRLNAKIFGVEAVANLLLSLWLVRTLGIFGVALGTAIPHIIMVIGVYPWLIRAELGISLREYFVGAILRGWAAVVPFAVTCFAFDRLHPASSLPMLTLQMLAAGVALAAGIWTIGLNAPEREIAVRSVLRRRAKVAPSAA